MESFSYERNMPVALHFDIYLIPLAVFRNVLIWSSPVLCREIFLCSISRSFFHSRTRAVLIYFCVLSDIDLTSIHMTGLFHIHLDAPDNNLPKALLKMYILFLQYHDCNPSVFPKSSIPDIMPASFHSSRMPLPV